MYSVKFTKALPLRLAALLLAAVVLLSGATGCGVVAQGNFQTSVEYDVSQVVAHSEEVVAEVPEYSGEPSVEVENNEPTFSEEEITDTAFEDYWPLDNLGRVTGAFGCVGVETMPTEERESIQEVHPTGWEQERYSWVDGGSLYNRCHLISHSLGAENANERNLMTGTRCMNTQGMLPYEIIIVNYIRETGNHVMYRVVPVFSGDNLVADGVHMQALSVEDGGRGVCFNVYCYNVEPGVEIDYATGENHADGSVGEAQSVAETSDYILNTKSMRIHRSTCDAATTMSSRNKKAWNGSVAEAEAQGYIPCASCNP